MSSYMANPEGIKRSWYIIDAAGKPLGRVAAAAASILRGKHLPTYTPHVDCGDHVIIINAEKVVLTGKKLENKSRFYHTGYVGGLKEIKYSRLMKTAPEKAIMYAVKGMVPDTVIGRKALTRVRIYQGNDAQHTAQNPQPWTGVIK